MRRGYRIPLQEQRIAAVTHANFMLQRLLNVGQEGGRLTANVRRLR